MIECKNIIIIPCYNEAARLRTSDFREFARGNPDTRLIFVDDCSEDDTLDVLRTLEGESGTQVEVISLARNLGKAGAVRAGMQAARRSGAAVRWLLGRRSGDSSERHFPVPGDP